MLMNPVTIRRAGSRDGPLLADLGARTFTETFGHLYPAGDLAAFLGQSYSCETLTRYLNDPAMMAWVMEISGHAVGYALAGACDLPHPEVTPNCGELKRLYLLKAARGEGRGSRLLDISLEWLETTGRRRIWIGVWSGNLGAQRLYGRMGFAKVGEYDFAVGATRDQEFVLRRDATVGTTPRDRSV